MNKWERDLHAAFDKTATPEAVRTARKLIKGELKPMAVSEAARNLHRQCHNYPDHHYLLMTALDDILGTCGVEYLGEVDMHDGPPVEYLNTGDIYATTLVYYRDSGKFKVQSYADAVEWCKRHGVLPVEG